MPECYLSPALKVNIKQYLDWLQGHATDPTLINEAKLVEQHVEELNICKGGHGDSGTPSKKDKKPGKKQNTHKKFLSYCMSGENKGGLGKSMSECSVDWRGMSDEDKMQFNPANFLSRASP